MVGIARDIETGIIVTANVLEAVSLLVFVAINVTLNVPNGALFAQIRFGLTKLNPDGNVVDV